MKKKKTTAQFDEQPDGAVTPKKGNGKFFIKYTIFVVVLLLIVSAGTYFTIKDIDKKYDKDLTVETSGNNIEEVKEDEEDEEDEQQQQNTADDAKYAINSYLETYNKNSIEINTYCDINGQITNTGTAVEDLFSDKHYNLEGINFIQINGLKNKTVQNNINAKLKSVPYSFSQPNTVETVVTANWSNVLSVMIRARYEWSTQAKYLNFDLTTGESIPFEKLFISSASVKYLVASESYKNSLPVGSFKQEDLAEREDSILLLGQEYEKAKDNMDFFFLENTIQIYTPGLECTIDMVQHASDIAIYKRYLTEESIFEDDSLGEKDLIVFTRSPNHHAHGSSVLSDYAILLHRGKLSDNILAQELLWKPNNPDTSTENGLELLSEEEMEVMITHIKEISAEKKALLKKETPADKGVLFFAEYSIIKNSEKGYYVVDAKFDIGQCPISFFESGEAFESYLRKLNPVYGGGSYADFSLYSADMSFSSESTLDWENTSHYFSLTGEFLGNTEEEALAKLGE